jgi:hypothetical protein
MYDAQVVAWPDHDGIKVALVTATGHIAQRCELAASGTRIAHRAERVLSNRARIVEVRAEHMVEALPPDNPVTGRPDLLIRPEHGAVFWLIDRALYSAPLCPDGLINWADAGEVEWAAIDPPERAALRAIADTLAETLAAAPPPPR